MIFYVEGKDGFVMFQLRANIDILLMAEKIIID